MIKLVLKHGYSIAEACRCAGIGRTTYYAELKRNQDFAYEMDKAKGYLLMRAKLIIAEAILDKKDVKTARWYLEHTGFVR